MKDLHDWNVTSIGVIDEILEPLENDGQLFIAPIIAVLPGLLYIYYKQCRLRNNHPQPSLTTSYIHISPVSAWSKYLSPPKAGQNETLVSICRHCSIIHLRPEGFSPLMLSTEIIDGQRRKPHAIEDSSRMWERRAGHRPQV